MFPTRLQGRVDPEHRSAVFPGLRGDMVGPPLHERSTRVDERGAGMHVHEPAGPDVSQGKLAWHPGSLRRPRAKTGPEPARHHAQLQSPHEAGELACRQRPLPAAATPATEQLTCVVDEIPHPIQRGQGLPGSAPTLRLEQSSGLGTFRRLRTGNHLRSCRGAALVESSVYRRKTRETTSSHRHSCSPDAPEARPSTLQRDAAGLISPSTLWT